MEYFLIGIIIIFIIMVKMILAGNTPKIEGDEFRQNGIIINFAKKKQSKLMATNFQQLILSASDWMVQISQ